MKGDEMTIQERIREMREKFESIGWTDLEGRKVWDVLEDYEAEGGRVYWGTIEEDLAEATF